MSTFGDQLKDARKARRLSLDKLAEATRIARHHLVALEKGDLGALPAGPFAKGYIEACAKVLDVDPGPILEAYRAEAQRRGLGTAETRDRMLDELTQLVERRSGGTGEASPGHGGRKGLLIGAGVVVAVAIGGWLVLRGGTTDEPSSTAASPTSTPRAPSNPPEDSAPPGGAPTTDEDARAAEPDRGDAVAGRTRPTPNPEPPRPNPNITIPDFGVGTGVENHNLVGAGDEFPERTEVVFWTRVVGGQPGDVVYHVWLHEGQGIARIPLTIGGSHWRTFSRRLLPQGTTGRWSVEARGVGGRLLARQDFVCVTAER